MNSQISLINRIFNTRSIPWLKLLILTGVLVLSIILPLMRSQSLQILMVGGVIGLGIILIFLRWPYLGIPLLIVASLLIPLDISVGYSKINASMMLVALLAGLWLLDMVARQRKVRIINSKPILSLLLFFLVVVLSFIVGQVRWLPISQNAPMQAQLGGLSLFILSALAFLLTAHQVKELRWLEWMTWLFLILGSFFVVGLIIPGTRRVAELIYQYGSTSSQFWIWMVAIALSQAIFNRRMDYRLKIALFGITLMTMYAAYSLSGWKSGWIPAAIVGVVLISLYSWKIGLIIVMGGIVLGPTLFTQLISSDEYSYATRMGAWMSIANIVKVNPILGLGPANYYWYTPYFRILDYYSVQFSSHNQYVDMIAQIGLIGLSCFLWFSWELTRLGWRLRKIVPAGFPNAYVFGALAGLVGTLSAGMLGDWVIPFVYNVGFVGFRASVYGWLFLGGLVALEQIYQKSEVS